MKFHYGYYGLYTAFVLFHHKHLASYTLGIGESCPKIVCYLTTLFGARQLKNWVESMNTLCVKTSVLFFQLYCTMLILFTNLMYFCRVYF